MKHYGQGKSTGIDQTALGAIQTGFLLKDMIISPSDRNILRPLAEKVAAIAQSDRMKEIRQAWKALNQLKPLRPVFFCDPENGWNEIITEAQMQCSGTLARRWEMVLRKKIFNNDQMQDDTPVEKFFDVPYTVRPEDWGLAAEFEKTQTDGAARWDSPLKNYDTDLEKICLKTPDIDWETTNACLTQTQQAFGDILDIRLKGTWWWSLGITMPFVFLRGLENMMFDFYDHPDQARELLSRISQGHLRKLDWLQQQGLLSLNNDGTYIGSGGYGYTDDLPAKNHSGKVTCRDLWGFTESQETVGISPELYESFIYPYEKPIMERFGLTCYGCCEPLDSRWNIVKKHHNLRRVSCSPWADYEKMAQYLKNDYIFSMKVHPADLAIPNPDFDQIRQKLLHNLQITKGCVIEIIMKDNHTIANRPENIVQWCRIARQEINNLL